MTEYELKNKLKTLFIEDINLHKSINKEDSLETILDKWFYGNPEIAERAVRYAFYTNSDGDRQLTIEEFKKVISNPDSYLDIYFMFGSVNEIFMMAIIAVLINSKKLFDCCYNAILDETSLKTSINRADFKDCVKYLSNLVLNTPEFIKLYNDVISKYTLD